MIRFNAFRKGKGIGRRGDVSDYVPWILNIGLYAVVIFLLNLGMTSNHIAYTDTREFEYVLMNERAFTSLLYTYPSTGVVDSGIIDIRAFDEKTLERIFPISNAQFGIKATLEYGSDKKEIFHNKKNFDSFRMFNIKRLEKSVLVKDGNELIEGKIIIENAFVTRRPLLG